MFIHFYCFEWREPAISDEFALELGEKIHRVGKEHLLWQFRKWVGSNPIVPPNPNAVIQELDLELGTPKAKLDDFFTVIRCVTHKVDWFILLGYLLICVGAAVDIGDRRAFYWMLGIGLFLGGLWVGSLFIGFRKYRKWINALLAKYLANA